jgi:hypothetical protein
MGEQRLSRLDRWSGPLFVLLAFVSSAAVSLPSSADPPARISELYQAHRVGYVVAQVIGLLGVGLLLIFLRALRKRRETQGRAITVTGLLVSAAAVGTNVAVLVPCFADGLTPAQVHQAAVATEVTDDILFAAFALLALALAFSAIPVWLRSLAALAALLCGVRAAEFWWRGAAEVWWRGAVDVVAPLTMLLVMLLLGLRLLRSGKASGGHVVPLVQADSAEPAEDPARRAPR